MNETTPRFGLPLLVPGQAQKEHFHNEALVILDALAAPTVEAVQADPPAQPEPGEAWIVAAGAAGAWAGRAGFLALWTDGGWRFIAPDTGLRVWNKAESVEWRWSEGAWTAGMLKGSALFVGGQKVVGERQPAVPSPSGGTIIDAEARLALDRVIVALKTHGLTD